MQYSAKSSTSKKQKASELLECKEYTLIAHSISINCRWYAQTCQAKEEEIQKEEFEQIKQSLVTKNRL